MFNFPSISFQQKQRKSISVWDNPLGLNTVGSAKSLMPGEFATCTNLKINDFGELVTRDGIKKVTSSAIGASVSTIKHVPVSTINYLFMVDSNYNVYAATGNDPTFSPGSSIGQMEGPTNIIPFNGKAVLLDGYEIKWSDGSAIYMAYDDGDGSHGYMYRNIIGSDTTSRALYAGATTKAGSYFGTTQWSGGRKIPFTSVDVWLSKTGSPTGNVYVQVYDVGQNWLITTSPVKAESLLTSAVEFNLSFTLDVSKGMESAGYYYVVVYYEHGDAANCVNVHSNVVASGGDHVYYDGHFHPFF